MTAQPRIHTWRDEAIAVLVIVGAGCALLLFAFLASGCAHGGPPPVDPFGVTSRPMAMSRSYCLPDGSRSGGQAWQWHAQQWLQAPPALGEAPDTRPEVVVAWVASQARRTRPCYWWELPSEVAAGRIGDSPATWALIAWTYLRDAGLQARIGWYYPDPSYRDADPVLVLRAGTERRCWPMRWDRTTGVLTSAEAECGPLQITLTFDEHGSYRAR